MREMTSDRTRIIDEALHHIEKQYVLRRLLAGASWSDAFGLGGRGDWRGDGKGIHFPGGTIAPQEILARAKEYIGQKNETYTATEFSFMEELNL